MKSTVQIIQELKNLTDGLYFLSETDAPFTLEIWDMDTKTVEQAITEHLPQIENAALEKTELDYFFRNAVKIYEGAPEEDVKIAHQFQDLIKYLKAAFHSVLVYRAGKIQVHIFIVCLTEKANQAVVLKTMAVET